MAVAPFLKRSGGRIVNIGSIAAYTGGRSQGSAIYAASKAGLNGLTVGLAREFSGGGVTVNGIAPGLVGGTEFTAAWDPARIEDYVKDVPAGRPTRSPRPWRFSAVRTPDISRVRSFTRMAVPTSRHNAKKATLYRLTEIGPVPMLRLEFHAGYGVWGYEREPTRNSDQCGLG